MTTTRVCVCEVCARGGGKAKVHDRLKIVPSQKNATNQPHPRPPLRKLYAKQTQAKSVWYTSGRALDTRRHEAQDATTKMIGLSSQSEVRVEAKNLFLRVKAMQATSPSDLPEY